MNIWMLLGCASDFGLNEEPAGADPVPVISVQPSSLALAAALGESATGSLWLTNSGDATLSLSGVDVLDSTRFTTDALTTSLAPGEEVELVVTFEAVTLQESATLRIYSNDPDTTELNVPLDGEALTALLTIEPDPLDFGGRTVDCDWQEALTFTNDGAADLELESMLATGEGFSLTPPALPVALAPGEQATATVTFSPTEALAYSGSVLLSSDAPAGDQSVVISGTGAARSLTEQTFTQGATIFESVDILFYIDQSGSMSDDQSRLEDNAEQFMADLSATAVDFQVMVVTSDIGCHNGTIITSGTADPVTAFVEALDGPPGGFTEAGLSILLAALDESGSGGCNAGFRREDVPLSAILISDEPEQSPDGWAVALEEVLAIAPETIISAIAGDYPDGCETAEAGTGYYDAVEATGGVYLSICAEDWQPHLEAISAISTETDGDITDTFYLVDYPDPATIVVTVDDAEVSGWQYDSARNAIVFETPPEDGAKIRVTFTRGCG